MFYRLFARVFRPSHLRLLLTRCATSWISNIPRSTLCITRDRIEPSSERIIRRSSVEDENSNSISIKGQASIRNREEEEELEGEATHLGQFADEVVGVGFLRRFDHLFLGDAVISVPDILPYRGVKEHRLLPDHAYVRAEPLHVQLRHVHAVQQNLSRQTESHLEFSFSNGRIPRGKEREEEGDLQRFVSRIRRTLSERS